MAISVAPELVTGSDAQEAHRVRAVSALTAFTNALTISLFALMPGENLGWAATIVAIVGLLSVAGALVGLVAVRKTQPGAMRDTAFLAGLVVVFGLQLASGLRLIADPDLGDPLHTICVLVFVCFLIGIARAWELVGGPPRGLSPHLKALRRKDRS